MDTITFGTAIAALAIVFVPQPPLTQEGRSSQGSFWKEAGFGFQYIFARPSLLGLQLLFFFSNLFAGIVIAVLPPMMLARTSQSTIALGAVQSAASIGLVVGGIAMSAWGGFKKRVHGVLVGCMFTSLAEHTIFGLGRGLAIWIPAAFVGALFVPLVNASNQAIWQAKVAPDLQGRVFSARRLIAWFTNPISPIIGGTLADFVLEPAMKGPSGFLATAFGSIVGTGPGAGMSLLIFFCGLGGLLAGLAGYFIPIIRDAENLLPDYETSPVKVLSPA